MQNAAVFAVWLFLGVFHLLFSQEIYRYLFGPVSGMLIAPTDSGGI